MDFLEEIKNDDRIFGQKIQRKNLLNKHVKK